MHTQIEMSKDQMFKLRLDAADRARLNDLAAHYSAPAATVVRMLIKQNHDAIAQSSNAREDYRDEHALIVHMLIDMQREREGRPVPRGDLDTPHAADTIRALHGGIYQDANFHGGIGRVLNELVRWGYIRRLKGPALVVLSKGRATRHPSWDGVKPLSEG